MTNSRQLILQSQHHPFLKRRPAKALSRQVETRQRFSLLLEMNAGAGKDEIEILERRPHGVQTGIDQIYARIDVLIDEIEVQRRPLDGLVGRQIPAGDLGASDLRRNVDAGELASAIARSEAG